MNTSDIKKLIEEIKATNPIRLQVKGKGDESPRPIGFYNAKKQFIPDIVARFEKKRNYYTIEKSITEKDMHSLVFKWILFAAEARKFSGKFFLVIPKSKADICNQVIQEKQLDFEVIAL
tara:strand:+ start:850 stop:1206 length:357 start_codon:yes stop_codon:yes gene_type:complete